MWAIKARGDQRESLELVARRHWCVVGEGWGTAACALTAIAVAPRATRDHPPLLGGGGPTLVGTRRGGVLLLQRASGAVARVGEDAPHAADVASVAMDASGRVFSVARDGSLLFREPRAVTEDGRLCSVVVERTDALHGLRMYVSTVVVTETLIVIDGFDNVLKCFDFAPIAAVPEVDDVPSNADVHDMREAGRSLPTAT